MMKGEIFQDYETCPYCERTYYEWDTGYSEYGCKLGDCNPDDTPCCPDNCPLDCRYEVEE